jgi:nitroreductase
MINSSNSNFPAEIPTIPLDYQEYPVEEVQQRALEYYQNMKRRRTVRDFSRRKVPLDIIENCIRTADTAPNGANQHPWHFVVVSDPDIKLRIREAAEKEEQDFYKSRASREWLEALGPLGTDEHKPFLETAPYLIAIFAKVHGIDKQGKRVKHYYVNESVGIATGLLISAIHQAGLASLTHTPSPMRFLNQILQRPERERPFLLLVVGYPATDTRVPDIQRKSLPEISTYF